MKKIQDSPPKKVNKDTFKTQLKKVFDAFYEQPRTMKEADFACGVMRENICRYVKVLKEQGQIYKLNEIRRCTRTRDYAFPYTTNPDLLPKQVVEQLPIPF